MAAVQETKTTRRRSPRKTDTQTTGRRTATRRPASEKSAEKARRTATVPVPLITPHLTVHKFHVPTPTLPVSGHEVVGAGKAATSFLPPPDRLAYYAGLGALAAFGVVEWPVAAAIGVGVAVAKRTGRSGEQQPQRAEPREREQAE